MSTILTNSILKKIFQEDAASLSQLKPVVQILSLKRISSSTERYRAMISDGTFLTGSAIFSGEPCVHCAAKLIDIHTIIQLNKFIIRPIQGKNVLIILSVEIITPSSEVEGKIGDPQPFLDSEMTQTSENRDPTAIGTIKSISLPERSDVPPRKIAKTSTQLNTSGTSSIFPIKSLTPYQNKWTIRARVSSKSPIKTWQNSRGEGKLFSIEFIDEQGEIRATGFNDAVDKFYDLLQEGNVYLISKGSLKLANKAFTSVKNEYEMTLNNDTIIERYYEQTNIPSIQYNFVKIADVETLPSNSMIDILGIIKGYSQIQSIMTRSSNRQVNKRELTIVDTTEKSITLALWGDFADNELYTQTDVAIAIKGVKVGDFNGKNLSSISSTHIELSPDIKEAHTIMGWYDNYGKDVNFIPLSSAEARESTVVHKMLHQISSERLGSGDKPDYLTVRGMVTKAKSDNALYKACPTPNCNKKVVDSDSYYRCEKCNQDFNNYTYRLILNFEISDPSGRQYVTAFQEIGEKILGRTADELGRLKDNTDEQSFDDAFKSALFKMMNFRLKISVDHYNDEIRTRCVCVNANPVDFLAESKVLIKKLLSV